MADKVAKEYGHESHSQPYIDPVIEAYKSRVDRTLIRQNLRLSVEERFEQLMSLQQLAEELRSAGKRLRE